MFVNNKIILKDIVSVTNANLPWHELSGKTILITGANGFLPSYMVFTLLSLHDQKKVDAIKVIGLVRNIEKATQRFEAALNRNDFTLVTADINQPIEIEEKIDVIIHAASQASPKYYGIDPVGTLSANTIGTYHLLNLAVKKNVQKFLYFSSSEVYGSLSNSDNIDETMYGSIDPTLVRSCYAESKRMGETLCVSFAAQHKLMVSMVRPFHTYGPGLSFDDGRVFADFVANVVKGENIVMNSDGSAVRSFCYISDATVGFFTVLLLGENTNAYNIGNPNGAISIKNLANLLISLYPEKKLQAIFNEVDSINYLKSSFNKLCPNINKANQLGWMPSTSIEEGFKRTIDSYQ
jgi:UDP-glucuronate decarboxylase